MIFLFFFDNVSNEVEGVLCVWFLNNGKSYELAFCGGPDNSP